MNPDSLADEAVRPQMAGAANGELDVALAGLAELRAGLPDTGGVAPTHKSRRDLEQRGA